MPVRTMYDAVTAGNIPADAHMVAGYSNGRYAWTAGDWARFPHAQHVRIDVHGDAPAVSDVLDVERGAATMEEVRGWIAARLPHGRACIYLSRSNVSALAAACAGLEKVDTWVADWTGEPHEVVLPGNLHLVAVQYKSTALWDESVVYGTWWPRGAVKS